MLFKLIPLALCAMSFVQAIPFSDNRNSSGISVGIEFEVGFLFVSV